MTSIIAWIIFSTHKTSRKQKNSAAEKREDHAKRAGLNSGSNAHIVKSLANSDRVLIEP